MSTLLFSDESSSLPPTIKVSRIRSNVGISRSAVSTPPPPPQVGFPKVRGYEISAILGRGGMGIVYEARHHELNRRVAIKMLHGEALADPEFHDRFWAEAEAIARLQHPNIIQVFEVGTVDPLPFETHANPFIALEYVNGGSLAERTREPQAPPFAARMVEKLARAAHAAHLLGVIHRDLKPANVLLTSDGEPKIADFGVAKQIIAECDARGRCVTLAGMTVGTPEYMAPEQVAGEAPTAAIDIYALGVILYELLTAHRPFQGTTPAETMHMVRHLEPVAPRHLLPGIPRDLETICRKCLEKLPGKRYESAEAMADDLARWSAGRAIRARAVGPVERAVRWARRYPTVAALSTAVVLLGIAGLTGVMWEWQEAKHHAADAEASAVEATRAAQDAQEATRRERWERYRVSVMAASGALRLHDAAGAQRALDDAPADHRDWVWSQLRAQLDQSRAVLGERGNTIRCANFTPDARWAVLRSLDGAVRIWDVAEQKEQKRLDLGSNPKCIALSNDGAILAYDLPDFTIRLCDWATGNTRTILRGNIRAICDISFSNDGARLITTSADNTLRVWDTATGRQLHRFRGPAAATPLLLSPNKRIVAARAGEGSPLAYVWDLETGRELAVLGGHEGSVHGLHFSPTGDRIVTVQRFPQNAIHLWDVATGQRLARLTGHENQVIHVQFSPDGLRLLTASRDRTVRIWDVSPSPEGGRRSEPIVLQGHSGGVNHAAFSSDGMRVASSSDDRTVRYWNARTGEQIEVLCGHTLQVLVSAFRADGKTLVSASADGTLRLWDVAGAESGYAIRGHNRFVYDVAFSPDGTRMFSAAWDGTARVWNPTTGREIRRLDHGADHYVSSVAVHSNGQFLATLSRHEGEPEMSVRLWDTNTGELLHRWATPSSWQDGRLAFAPRGDLLAASGVDGRVRLWDSNNRSEVAVLECGKSPVRDVAFSPDGKLLAAACDDGDCTIRVWDVSTRRQIQILRGHERGVYAVAWNRTGTMLASGSLDHTARLWDTTTWTSIEKLSHGTDIYGVAFTPDGKLLACACADN